MSDFAIAFKQNLKSPHFNKQSLQWKTFWEINNPDPTQQVKTLPLWFIFAMAFDIQRDFIERSQEVHDERFRIH